MVWEKIAEPIKIVPLTPAEEEALMLEECGDEDGCLTTWVRQDEPLMGTCVECGRACLMEHEYVVRTTTWREAGMPSWDSGHLHLACLERRLGREVSDAEVLAWCDEREEDGRYRVRCQPEYLSSPELLEH